MCGGVLAFANLRRLSTILAPNFSRDSASIDGVNRGQAGYPPSWSRHRAKYQQVPRLRARNWHRVFSSDWAYAIGVVIGCSRSALFGRRDRVFDAERVSRYGFLQLGKVETLPKREMHVGLQWNKQLARCQTFFGKLRLNHSIGQEAIPLCRWEIAWGFTGCPADLVLAVKKNTAQAAWRYSVCARSNRLPGPHLS